MQRELKGEGRGQGSLRTQQRELRHLQISRGGAVEEAAGEAAAEGELGRPAEEQKEGPAKRPGRNPAEEPGPAEKAGSHQGAAIPAEEGGGQPRVRGTAEEAGRPAEEVDARGNDRKGGGGLVDAPGRATRFDF